VKGAMLDVAPFAFLRVTKGRQEVIQHTARSRPGVQSRRGAVSP
jgi:hypothetical protein